MKGSHTPNYTSSVEFPYVHLQEAFLIPRQYRIL